MMENKHYRVSRNHFDPEIITKYFNIDLENLAKHMDPSDVFRCEHGIKQIQNLHKTSWPEYQLMIRELKGFFSSSGANVKVLNMQYFVKHPDYKMTYPHQDGAYFNAPDKHIVTCWIPLQDVSIKNSCMHYLTKHWPSVLFEHENVGTQVRTRTGKTGYSQYCEKFALAEFHPVEMKLGDMLVHDQYALHYANENSTQEKRIALTCILELENYNEDVESTLAKV